MRFNSLSHLSFSFFPGFWSFCLPACVVLLPAGSLSRLKPTRHCRILGARVRAEEAEQAQQTTPEQDEHLYQPLPGIVMTSLNQDQSMTMISRALILTAMMTQHISNLASRVQMKSSACVSQVWEQYHLESYYEEYVHLLQSSQTSLSHSDYYTISAT